MITADSRGPASQFRLLAETGGPLSWRQRINLHLTASELLWKPEGDPPQRRHLRGIRSVTLGQFLQPHGGTAWLCEVNFGSGKSLRVICLSGDTRMEQVYRQFVEQLHGHLLASGNAAGLDFMAARSRRLKRVITFGILPLAGIGCLVGAFATGFLPYLLLAGTFLIVGLIQVEELHLNNGQRYDPAALPRNLLP